MRLRGRTAIFAALLAVPAAAALLPSQGDSSVLPAPGKESGVAASSVRPPSAWPDALPARRALPAPQADLFATKAWAVPPQQVARGNPPPAPAVIPEIPYRFAGTSRLDGLVRFYLSDGDRTYEAKEGDLLPDGTRVAAVTATAIMLVGSAPGAEKRLDIEGASEAQRPVQRSAAAPRRPPPKGDGA